MSSSFREGQDNGRDNVGDKVIRGNWPDVTIPDTLTVSEYILGYADKFGDIDAFIDPVTDTRTTYRQLAACVRSLSHALHEQGLRKGEPTFIFATNHFLYVALTLAVPRLGAILSTCNAALTAREVAIQLEDSSPKFIFTDSALLPTMLKALDSNTSSTKVFLLDDCPSEGASLISELIATGSADFVPEVEIDTHEDVAYLPYSSGTTGLPKGVMLTHYNIVANICQSRDIVDFYKEEGRERYILYLPLAHIYGLVVIALIGLSRGNTIVLMPKFDFKIFLQCVEKYQLTSLHIVPPVAVALAKHPMVKSVNFESVKTVLCGAAPLGSDLEKEVCETLGVSMIKQGFGMTELSPAACITHVDNKTVGSIGNVIPNTLFKIVSVDSGEALGPNMDGELLVHGPQVMKGYWRRPDATAQTIQDGWMKTGDLCHYDEDGNFFVSDRIKELIKYKGYQVAPAELEDLLLTQESVIDSAVIGLPGGDVGELPKAFVVRKPGSDVTEEQIKEFVADKTANFKHLRGGVEFVDAIPKSASGKILRRVLKEKELAMRGDRL